MQFDLQGSDRRFEPLRWMLEADGHRIGPGGYIIAPPSQRRGLPYYRQESYALKNAALTAEAAVSLLEKDGGMSVETVLVTGCGRVGRELCRRLREKGCAVTAAARREKTRAEARKEGFQAVDIISISGTYDAVINTVPAPVLRGNYGAELCMELASAPGGWADDTPVLRFPALPALYAPERAAEILRDAIYDTLKEDELWKN